MSRVQRLILVDKNQGPTHTTPRRVIIARVYTDAELRTLLEDGVRDGEDR